MKKLSNYLIIIILISFLNISCIINKADESPEVNASFTNLTEDIVWLYIDGKIETQIFPQTVYWVGLAKGVHTFSVLTKDKRYELLSGEFKNGDKINIISKF